MLDATALGGGVPPIKLIVAVARASAGWPLGSMPVTWARSVCESPGLPMKVTLNVQATLSPGCKIMLISWPQVESGRIARLWYTLSVSDVILMSSSVVGLLTVIV